MNGYYVYVIGEAQLLAGLDGFPGIDDAPVTPVTHGRLSALTSVVGLDAFHAAQQAREVSETGWLAQAVRAHERVALHALDRAPVLPMRFGTVYPNGADVSALLQRHQASLLDELERLAGGTEWSLKVSVVDAARDAEHPSAAETGSGTAWLLARQAALHARQQQADRLADCVEQLRAELAGQVRDIVVSRPLSGASDAARMWLLVNDVERLHDTFESVRARQHDVALELTGPWPPYHFVRTDALHDADRVAQP
jgi:Gas vesicle synthesis protein GvpL/GvpF